jgi:uncharacterized spore protein YtfJ
MARGGSFVPRRAFAALRRIVSARHVFGKPVERDGVTVIPVATVWGGGGGGGGYSPPQQSAAERAALSFESSAGEGKPSEGGGIGFGLIARPTGAFEVTEEGVRWKPAIDYTLLFGCSIVAGAIVARWAIRELADR